MYVYVDMDMCSMCVYIYIWDFDERQAVAALTATGGSLEGAADWYNKYICMVSMCTCRHRCV